MSGRVLTIHLLEGSANGIQTAEIDNWIGKVFVTPKADLPNLLQQPELQGRGVYVLVGSDPDIPDTIMIYVGEGYISDRLTFHSKNGDKAFWDDKTVVIIASSGVLDKADCQYLESRLVELAGNAKVANLKNSQLPSPHQQNLSVPKKAAMENFLAQIQVLFPVLNINFFVTPPKLLQSTAHVLPPPPSPTFLLVTGTVQAEAELVNNKFVVRQGSLASGTETSALGIYNLALRNQLKHDGKLVNNTGDGKYIFSQDVEFNSPSAAAAVLCGHNVAGPAIWKVKGTDETYGMWLQAQVDAIASISDSIETP